MAERSSHLRVDPVSSLLSSGDEALLYFVNRDLLDREMPRVDSIWDLKEVQGLKIHQNLDGSWSSRKEAPYKNRPVNLIETFKRFRLLVRQYGSTKEDVSTAKAAEYIFSCQSDEGDFRGFLGNQYATYYTGDVTALLILAGYSNDKRIEKAFKWLISMRQDDEGWAVPILTHNLDRKTSHMLMTEDVAPLQPIRSKPFSHFCTDMVLRAFAVHPEHRSSLVARKAGSMLKKRFFKPDSYRSYQHPRYWTRFLFWWPNVLTSLDSLSRIGFRFDDPEIKVGLDWFRDNQQPSGLWKVSYEDKAHLGNARNMERSLWVTLNICRLFKRFNGSTAAEAS